MINKAYNDIVKTHRIKEDAFSDDLTVSRKKLGIPLGGFDTLSQQIRFYFENGTSGMDKLTSEAIKILKKNDLPHTYHYHMSLYLIGDEICLGFTEDNVGVCEFDPASGIGVKETEIGTRWLKGNIDFRTLYISKDATKESIIKYVKDYWPFVEVRLKDGETTKHKEEKKYERNLRILDLSTYDIKELENTLVEKDHIKGENKRERLIKKIIEREFKSHIAIKTIKNIISRMRKSHFKHDI